LRHHGEHDLAMELDFARDEHRVVTRNGADVVDARYIRGGQHRDDAGRCAHCVQVHSEQLSGRHRRAADRDMQQPLGFADVVDEGGAAGDMFRRGIVPHRAAHDAQPHLFGTKIRLGRHWQPP
jgi:hypothetical protein